MTWTPCPVCGAADRPLLADLCSGAGGAGRGYQLAGLHAVGFDVKPQPRYPGCFVQADITAGPLPAADAYHASPPCTDHMRWRCAFAAPHGTGWLLSWVRLQLAGTRRPWVIENVPGAPLRADYRLCGCMFGLRDDEWLLIRERWFETSWAGFQLRPPCVHDRRAITVIKNGAFFITTRRQPSGGHVKQYIPMATAAALMGIDWMRKKELGEAIPPAYTEHVGADLMALLQAVAAGVAS
jgi:DNA (cytosine-5)-methyltransferase 1